MYCKHCGEQMDDNAKFCSKCGKSVETQEKKELFKNKNLKFILIGLAVLVVGILILCISSKYIKVDMEKYYDITFSGLDGNGTVQVEINEAENEKLAKKLVKGTGESASDLAPYMALMKLDYEFSKEEGLSNGEEIIFTVSVPENFEKRYKIKAINLEQKIVVEGLIIPEEIDVFDGLEIECSGRSPFITCNVVTGKCNDFTKEYVEFEVDKGYYADGEEVKILASYSEEVLVQEKVKVLKDKAVFVAESDEKYIDSLNDIDLTGLREEMYKQLQLEYSASDEYFFGIELGWTNHYAGLLDEAEKGSAFLVLKDVYDYDEEKTPYNIYVVYYRDKIAVEHRSRGNEGTFETEMDVLLIAKNLYLDANNELHYDELIEVEADEVDSISDLKSVYIKDKQYKYNAIESK